MSEEYADSDAKTNHETHEAIIFAIELTDSIHFINASTGKSNLLTILEALEQSMAHSAITLPNTGYGLYMFNGKKTTEDLKPGIECVFPLRDLNVKSMKLLHDILSDSVSSNDVEAPYVPLDERFKPRTVVERSNNPLFELLTTLQHEFFAKREMQKQYTINKIFLFTDNDAPVQVNDVDQKNLIRRICADLDDSRITITPFFLTSKEQPFSNELYSELMFLPPLGDPEDSSDAMFDGPSTKPIDVQDIASRIRRRKEIKRVQFQCPFIMRFGSTKEVVVGVKGYSVISHEKAAPSKWLYEDEHGRKNVYTLQRNIDETKGGDFDQTIKGYPVGVNGDVIPVTKEQIEDLDKYDDEYATFLRLIGTKDERSGIKSHYVTGRSTFLTPSEDDYEGSTRTLSALYFSLRSQAKVAILFGKLRKGSQPFYYALQPAKRQLFPGSKVHSPEGFYLHRLPYLDDLRQIPNAFETQPEPEEELKDASRLVLKDLMSFGDEYVPQDVKNPTLNQHYRTIREFKLQVERPTKQEPASERDRAVANDDTLRDVDSVRKAIEASQLDNEGPIYRHITSWNATFSGVQ